MSDNDVIARPFRETRFNYLTEKSAGNRCALSTGNVEPGMKTVTAVNRVFWD